MSVARKLRREAARANGKNLNGPARRKTTAGQYGRRLRADGYHFTKGWRLTRKAKLAARVPA